MLPTPSTSHVDTRNIYEPAEDSFLLLDTLSSPSEAEFLTSRFSPFSRDGTVSTPLILEVGTGSGVILAFMTAHAKTLLGRNDVLSLGIDVNRCACQATKETVIQACNDQLAREPSQCSGTFLDAAVADLATPLKSGAVDILLFNPPYVPTVDLPRPLEIREEENDRVSKSTHEIFNEDSRLLELSYAGGADGMEVTNMLLDQIPAVLSPRRGVAYILLCRQNHPGQMMQRIRDWGSSWAVDVVGSSGKTAGWERLVVIRIQRR
ncbi:S-adenosylmethionine-dependent methyltransferase [Loxospora ochrophaea]|nr:S-adenosylmethionine-dependent methyltransferase [Loxospora ochrophaea]